ncbi:MAG: 1-deoxy-D-xylulose-5-phosphate reductoisomerase [Candidatus Melainabacteria bacterium GWF2_32_7]|nr:MAG: 1-deoxy-D-xylulose-5-phosphate reductoisomerase [Candidatus Melainabacteria bacterium GWF2_32_7]
MKKKISILGSTGSIGKQALEVVDCLQERFEIVGLAAGSNLEEFKKQITKYNPEFVSVKTAELALELKKDIKNKEILWGNDGLVEIAKNTQNDIILSAVTGLNGLFPVLAAVDKGIDIALANKETLVAAGNIVMNKAKEKNVKILPVDSEHSAIFQCLASRNFSNAKKLIITGSGGPFRNKSPEEIKYATLEETLAHPNWSMGDKITVDSATLMNKGLEVIEAHRLFGIDYKNIEVVIHPQSIVHSAVEFLDGSVIAQMGLPSMHIPIQYALTYPETFEGIKTGTMDFAQISKLEFEKPDLEKFPCLTLAYEAGIKDGTYPTVLNASNEEAVLAFLKGKIKLTEIYNIVYKALEQHNSIQNPELKDIIETDKETRIFTRKLI